MALQVACEAFIVEAEVTCNCEPLDAATIEGYIDQASDILAILTGGQVSGRCQSTVRPRGISVCGRGVSCTCSYLTGVTLMGPNPTIDSLTVDGAAFTDYKLVDGRLLIRTDDQAWPSCQNLADAATEDGTFEITYTHGDVIPQLAKDACAEIVCSFVTSNPQDNRKSHPGVRGMSIAGVSISLEQQAMEIKNKAFMMPTVIRLLTVYAPDGPQPAVVYSPELEDGWKLHRVS